MHGLEHFGWSDQQQPGVQIKPMSWQMGPEKRSSQGIDLDAQILANWNACFNLGSFPSARNTGNVILHIRKSKYVHNSIRFFKPNRNRDVVTAKDKQYKSDAMIGCGLTSQSKRRSHLV